MEILGNGRVLVEGATEVEALGVMLGAGFEALPPRGTVERFGKEGLVFERASAFLSGGKVCFVFEEVK